MKHAFLICLLVIAHFINAQPLVSPVANIKLTTQVECTSIKDQYMSSTCWSFASNSFLESELIKKGVGEVDLSEMYIARYSYINKIKQHLATKGKTYFTPGGQFHDVLKVVREYGLMPENAYSGKGRKEINHDHGELDTLMKYKIADCVKAGKTQLTPQDSIEINALLDTYFGKVPKLFPYKGKIYTPQLFAKEYLQFNAGDYIEITSYTHHPFYAPFVLEDKYNWTYDEYLNLPLNSFMRITDSALANGYSVCWDGDVTEKEFQFNNQIAWLAYPVKNFQQERQRTYEDKTSAIDHMMHIVGVGFDKEGKKWYYLKNSWGATNSAGGYMYMRDDYFKVKTIAVIVNKNAIPADIRRKMKTWSFYKNQLLI